MGVHFHSTDEHTLGWWGLGDRQVLPRLKDGNCYASEMLQWWSSLPNLLIFQDEAEMTWELLFFFLFVGWSWLTDIFDIFVEIATCLILWNSTHIDLCFKFKSLISSLQMRLEPQRQRRPFPTKFCLLDLRLLLCLKQKFNKQWLSIVSYEKSHSAKKFLHKTISISGQSSQFNI